MSRIESTRKQKRSSLKPRLALGLQQLEPRIMFSADVPGLADAVDPNDQLVEARSLGAVSQSLTVTDAISPGTDVDMYSFSVSSGQAVAFDIDCASGSDLDSYLRIFDSSGREVASNDDGQAPGESFSFESYLEHTFTSGGTYYAGVSGYGNSTYSPTTGNGDESGSQGGYILRLSGTTPVVDTDDQISEAQNLGAMTAARAASGSISPSTDVDMYRFSVSSGQTVAFDIDGASGSDLDSYLRIFDSSGRDVASNDDGQAPGESFSFESYLEHTFTSGGTYYAGVSGYGNSSYSPTSGNGDGSGSQGGYTLRLSGSVAMPTDADDQISEAQNLGAMTATRTANGSISPSTDVDMYRFSVSSGQRVAFDIDRASGSDLDSYLRIFDSSGREVVRNDDGQAPGEPFSYESYLEYTFASGGTYYAGVSGYGNSSYNATTGSGDSSGSQGGYTLRLSATTPIVDSDDQISEAQNLGSLTAPRTANGSINRGTDVDMFAFSVTSGQRVAFDIDGASGSDLDSYLRIFDSSGREVARNDDAAAPGESFSYESYLEHTFTSGGTYYAGVSGYGNSSYNATTGNGDSSGSQGGYTLRLSGTTPIVDPDDQISEAQNLGAMTAARTANGSIDRATDVDMYRFSVSSGQTVAFDIDRASGSDVDSYLRIFDSSGREVARNDDGQAPGEPFSYESYLEYTFTSGGTYYAGVSGYGNSSYSAATGNGDSNGSQGSYVLRLSGRTPVVDTDDQISEAQNLGTTSAARTANGSIDRATDVDMYRFSVSSGQTVAFDIDRASGSDLDSYLRIFDSSGREVVRNDDGQAPGEPFSYESYLEYTFTSGGAYYAGVSGYGNSSYDATSGTGDHDGSQGGYTLTVTPLTGVSQIVGTVAQPSRAPTGNSPETINVTLECVDGASSGTIESGRRTWVVAHGRASRSASFTPLAAEIAEYEEGDQVLTLDWSDGAGDNWPSLVGMDGAGWIPGVADWAAGVLHGIGLQTEDLFFVGHSWGTWLSYEMATRVAGGVQGIVALDPAADASFEYDASDVDFGDVAQASWAFHGGGLFGSPTRAATADESFTTTYSASRPIGDLARHSMPVDIFTDLVRESNSARPSERARLFSLDRLVADQAGSWREDVYNSAGSPIGLWRTFEGVFELDYQAGDWQTSLLRYTTPDGATARV